MATPKKLPSGQWRAQGYYKDPVTGKIDRPSFTAPSKAEATRMVAEWETQKNTAKKPVEMSVADCIDRYITAKESSLSPSTIRGYRKMQRNNYSDIGPKQLKYLTDEDMQLFVSRMCADHSPKTVRNVYALLSSAISMFTMRQFRVSLPQKQEPERHIPTDGDVKNLMAMADLRLKKGIALGAVGTLREGEVCALLYGDVDYSQSIIHVHADMVQNAAGEWVIKPSPKTVTSNRLIPVPQEVIDLIGTGDPDQRIVDTNPSALGHAFARLRNKLGLECRFHDLRHYAASIMHAIGVPDVYIMERGGWKSDTVLKSIYRNSLSDQSAKFAARANEHFSGLF